VIIVKKRSHSEIFTWATEQVHITAFLLWYLKMVRRQPVPKQITPLPAKKIAILGLILAANNMSVWMIFSFLPFMVEDFFPLLTTKELGYRAGILGTVVSISHD
jgi:hypothetical protein